MASPTTSSNCGFSGFNKDHSKLIKKKHMLTNKPVCLTDNTCINDANFQIYTLKYSNLLGI